METTNNWNQKPQPVKAEIVVFLTHGEKGEEFFTNLSGRLWSIINLSEKWRQTPENLLGYDWSIPSPKLQGLCATYEIFTPVKTIAPSQLRAFYAHINRFAEKLAEEEIPGVDGALAKIYFELYSQIYK